MPPANSVHIDQALTNLSIMYRNANFLADMVLPVVPVNKRSNKYFVYRREDYLSGSPVDAQGRPASLRKQGSEAAEIDYQVNNSQYFCEEYAYRGIVTDAEVAAADSPVQPEIDQTTQNAQRLLLDNEIAVAALVGKRASYATANKATLTTGGTGTSWAQYASANSNPFNDIKNAKIAVIKGIAMEPNSMLIGVDAARTAADHPLVKDLVKYTHQDALTMSGLPKVWRGLSVMEGMQQKNAGGEGAAFSGSNVWVADDGTQMALIYYRNANPAPRSVSFGYTFEAPDDTTGVRGLAVRKWREEKRKGMMVETSFMRDWKVIALDAANAYVGGYLLSSVTV